MNEVIRPTDELPVSVLKADHIVFDELSFVRNGFLNKSDSKTNFNLSYGIDKISDGEYKTTLTAQAVRENEFEAKVQISGYWSIDETDANKDRLLQENALAILFPYVRSEMTLLTAQPETEPIVWPAMNINKMMSSAEEADSNH